MSEIIENIPVTLEEAKTEDLTREELLSLLRQKENVERNYEHAIAQTRRAIEEIKQETDEALKKLKERNDHMETYIRNRESEFADFKKSMNFIIKGLDHMTSQGGEK